MLARGGGSDAAAAAGAAHVHALCSCNLAFSSDGAAIIARATQLLLQANPTWIDVESDLASAFQRACRKDIAIELVHSHLNSFLPLFDTLYGDASVLFYEDFSEFISEEGSQQGCPLGGLLFILSIASIAEDVAARFPDVTILGFADDYRFVGPVQLAMDAALEFRTRVVAAGHVDQVEKAWALSLSQASINEAKQHPLANIVSAEGKKLQFTSIEEGLRTVGAPVGTPEFRTDWYMDYVQSKVKPHLLALRELANHDNDYAAQSAFMILRYCASAKFDFLLRTAPPALVKDGALAHDDLIVDCLTSILDVNSPTLFDEGHSPSAFAQASLPTCQGGLGIGSALYILYFTPARTTSYICMHYWT